MLIFISLLLGMACQEQVSRCDSPACSADRKTVKEWDEKEGIVEYDQEAQMYLVNVGESPDIHIFGYACNLPEEFRIEGMSVIVSGELKEDCNELSVIFAAQENYYLHIDDVRLVVD